GWDKKNCLTPKIGELDKRQKEKLKMASSLSPQELQELQELKQIGDDKDWTYDDYCLLQLATLVIMDLYIFELIYRPKMRIPLIIHHLSTIGITLLGYYILNETENVDSSAESILLLLQITTDRMNSIDLLFNEITPTWEKITHQLTAFQEMLTNIGTFA
ncbi:17040_t:CDS:2, partial [Acaulospora morrowiae]